MERTLWSTQHRPLVRSRDLKMIRSRPPLYFTSWNKRGSFRLRTRATHVTHCWAQEISRFIEIFETATRAAIALLDSETDSIPHHHACPSLVCWLVYLTWKINVAPKALIFLLLIADLLILGLLFCQQFLSFVFDSTLLEKIIMSWPSLKIHFLFHNDGKRKFFGITVATIIL